MGVSLCAPSIYPYTDYIFINKYIYFGEIEHTNSCKGNQFSIGIFSILAFSPLLSIYLCERGWCSARSVSIFHGTCIYFIYTQQTDSHRLRWKHDIYSFIQKELYATWKYISFLYLATVLTRFFLTITKWFIFAFHTVMYLIQLYRRHNNIDTAVVSTTLE